MVYSLSFGVTKRHDKPFAANRDEERRKGVVATTGHGADRLMTIRDAARRLNTSEAAIRGVLNAWGVETPRLREHRKGNSRGLTRPVLDRLEAVFKPF